ncbi:putative glutamate/gamma-aminobutyrate antiporter [Nocardia otitidiscaviarum]|uniref:Putative glutamate/gamma-aminobutyrate antiporter n=2 Tax=Nocardia otitidiscaviarum TaxID=1823 RepID=A0A378YGL9_9NOCA|nr:putative glutamate/gamma-aminobutyrate antiporter [Nocardia otitidiscaviarum]
MMATTRAATATNYLPWITLALMTTSSVASLRAAPTMAVYGLVCVFLYLLPAVLFLLPTAFVAAELASGWAVGVYRWVGEGISQPAGTWPSSSSPSTGRRCTSPRRAPKPWLDCRVRDWSSAP